MDDLSLLAKLRDNVPAPDPAVLASARERLVERTLEAAPAATPASQRHGERHGERRGRGRVARIGVMRLAAAAAIVIVAAVGLVVADTVTIGGATGGASAEAATLLEQAATNSVGATGPTVGPQQFLKITTTAWWSSTAELDGRSVTWLEEEVIELWVPGDRSREWVQRRSGRTPVHFFNPDDEAAVREAGLETITGPPEVLRAADGGFYGPVTASWQTPTAEFLAGLPRDPEALLDRIYSDSEGQGNSKDGEALVFVADVLRAGTVPAYLRASLFRAATYIPGIDVVDQRANLSGRIGVAVGRAEEDGIRQEIVFDPATGQFIGERQVVLRDDVIPGIPASSVVGLTAVTAEVVDQAL